MVAELTATTFKYAVKAQRPSPGLISIAPGVDTVRWITSPRRNSKNTGFTRSARVVLVAAAKAARPASNSRSALAAFAVNNCPELFKPPETTRSNHPKAYNAAPKQLT